MGSRCRTGPEVPVHSVLCCKRKRIGGGETGRGKCSPDFEKRICLITTWAVLLIIYCTDFKVSKDDLAAVRIRTCLVLSQWQGKTAAVRKDASAASSSSLIQVIVSVIFSSNALSHSSLKIPRDKPGQDTTQGSTCGWPRLILSFAPPPPLRFPILVILHYLDPNPRYLHYLYTMVVLSWLWKQKEDMPLTCC